MFLIHHFSLCNIYQLGALDQHIDLGVLWECDQHSWMCYGNGTSMDWNVTVMRSTQLGVLWERDQQAK